MKNMEQKMTNSTDNVRPELLHPYVEMILEGVAMLPPIDELPAYCLELHQIIHQLASPVATLSGPQVEGRTGFHREHYERILTMAYGVDGVDGTWNFSPDEKAALEWVCKRLDTLVAEAVLAKTNEKQDA